MSVSSFEVWQRIETAELASPEEVRKWGVEVAEQIGASASADGLQVLEFLVRSGKLSKLQGKLISANRAREFCKGNWRLRDRASEGDFDAWFEASLKGAPEHRRWIRWFSSDDLQQLAASAPSLRRMQSIADFSGDGFCRFDPPWMDEGQLFIAMEPLLDWRPLTEPVAADASNRVIRDLVQLVAKFHASGIVLGRIALDRLWFNGEGALQVMVDPLCATTAFPGSNGRSLGILPTRAQPAIEHFLAPESVAPGFRPSTRSDVYSLGSVIYWLLYGRPLFEEQTGSGIMAAQATESVRFERHLALDSAKRKVLEYSLAKNPASRFASANEFFQAWCQADKLSTRETQPSKVSKPSGSAQVHDQPATSTRVQQPAVPSEKKSVDSRADRTAEKPGVQKTRVEKSSHEALAQSTVRPEATAQTAKKRPVVKAALVDAESSSKDTQSTTLPKAENSSSPSGTPQASNSLPASSSQSPKELELPNVSKPSARPKTLSPSSHALQASRDKSEAQLARNSAAQVQPETQAESKHATSLRQSRRRRANSTWLLRVGGGVGVFIVLLFGLKLSGVLDTRNVDTTAKERPAYVPPTPASPEVSDPRLNFYEVTDNSNDLWLPIAAPEPLDLSGLPDGAQVFVRIRIASLESSEPWRQLATALGNDAQDARDWLTSQLPTALEACESVTIAFYASDALDREPRWAIKQELRSTQKHSDLVSNAESKFGKPVIEGNRTEFSNGLSLVANAAEDELVQRLIVGPSSLLVDAEFESSPVLTAQIEELLKRSSDANDLVVLGSPRFLFTNGFGLLENGPARLPDLLRELLGFDSRAVLFQSKLSDELWYGELSIVGASDSEAPRLAGVLQERIHSAGDVAESWIIAESPSNSWRALALRFPQMLRALARGSRVGVENGAAVANFYLPLVGFPNLAAASWIALHDGATSAVASDSPTARPKASEALSDEEFLAQTIRVQFDQEPIEQALALVAEEANERLPSGSPKVEFALDGDAFEKAGITRNQQLRNFSVSGGTVREALTEIVKRGNPVTTVTDTRQADQKLVWVLFTDEFGERQIQLTTRSAAASRNLTLPEEFVPR